MFDVYAAKTRIEKLGPAQRRALAWVILDLRKRRQNAPSEKTLQDFLLPFAEMGFDLAIMMAMAQKMPEGWPFDHREVYFDFRLQRWMRILDAPTLDECFEDYVGHAPSEDEALDYIGERVRTLMHRHGREWPASIRSGR